jgi:hypothetical protein
MRSMADVGVGVSVGGSGVTVGVGGRGAGVAVGGTEVDVGPGIGVAVRGKGVGLDEMVGAKVGRGVTLCATRQADSETTIITDDTSNSRPFRDGSTTA